MEDIARLRKKHKHRGTTQLDHWAPYARTNVYVGGSNEQVSESVSQSLCHMHKCEWYFAMPIR